MQTWNAIGRLGIAVVLLTFGSAQAAVIYKWTDKDGVIHYSDQAVPGAEKIVTSSSSNNGIGSATRGASATTGKPTSGKSSTSRLEYAAFAVESPAKDQVFFADEVIPVRLHLEPDLKPQQGITWQLNGAPLSDQANAKDFALQSLARGTYTLSATVTDLVSGETQGADVTFYVRQPSELAPLHRKP